MGRVTEQAQNVAYTVREQAEGAASLWRVLMSKRSIQLRDQGISSLRNLTSELREMGESAGTTAARGLVGVVADRLDAVSADLEQRDPMDMLIEARSYARAHPTQVTIGMFASGLIMGRLLRGSRKHHPTIDVREGFRQSDTGRN
jgi:hypothetical protein